MPWPRRWSRKSERQGEAENRVLGHQSRKERHYKKRNRERDLGAVENLYSLLAANAGANQPLLGDAHFGLALGQHLFEMLNHASQRSARLLNGLDERPLPGLGIDDLADTLDHRFPIEQQEQAAAQQNKDHEKCDNCKHIFAPRNPTTQSCE